MQWNSTILKAQEVRSDYTGSDIHKGKTKRNLSLWIFAVYLLKKAKWDSTLKKKSKSRGRMTCILISLCASALSWICYPAEPAAHSCQITECMCSTLVWEVFTISIIFHVLPTRLPNCSSLWCYKSVQINMKSKSHCCDLNLQLPETLAISIISFLLLLDHISISVCFCYLISKIHQLQQQDSNCSFGKWNYLNHSNIRIFYMFYYLWI